MAKLSGVNVVAEKITYNGVEYVKTAEAAKAGDILRISNENEADVDYITDGGYYVVDYVDNVGDPQITDDDGDEYDTLGEDYEVFTKVISANSAPVSETPTQYCEVKRRANAGERIRIVAGVSYSDYNNGDEFVVKRVDPDGDAHITDNVGDEECVFLREYVVLEPIAETPKDKRIPVGHYGRITGNGEGRGDLRPHRFPLGEVVKIVEHFSEFPDRVRAEYLDGHDWWTVHNDDIVEVAEPYVQPSEVPSAKQPEISVGDYVKVADAGGNGRSKVGDIAKVTDKWGSGELAGIDAITADRREVGAWEGRFTMASAEDIAAYEKSVAISAIKPGMYARITKYQCGDPVGTVAEITNITDGRITYKSEKVTSGTYVSGYGSYEVLSSDETAEFKRKKAEEHAKAAEERKWAKIGRKVGEIKAGDIVKVTRGCGGHKDGIIGVAKRDGSTMSTAVLSVSNPNTPGMSVVELIAPVESLFNVN